MKIMKEKRWAKQYDCSGQDEGKKGCGSTLLVDIKDLRYFRDQERAHFTKSAVVCFKCPVCNTINYIPKTDWPPSYANLAKGFE